MDLEQIKPEIYESLDNLYKYHKTTKSNKKALGGLYDLVERTKSLGRIDKNLNPTINKIFEKHKFTFKDDEERDKFMKELTEVLQKLTRKHFGV